MAAKKSQSPATERVAEALVVVARTEGFRRAGRAWSTAPTTVPLDQLTEAAIEALKGEPMLSVIYVGAGGEKVSG